MEQEATFTLDTKAVVREEDGDLIIEGYASDYGEDRQDEAFAPGAFDSAIKSFMENPALLYHHDFAKALGRVTQLERRNDGLWMKAVIDKPAPNSWASDIYNKVKSGTIKGLSVGGKFYRSLLDGKPVIHKADLMEISVTPMPVNPRTLFAVAGKAFADSDPLDLEAADTAEIERQAIEDLNSLLDVAEGVFDTVSARCHSEG